MSTCVLLLRAGDRFAVLRELPQEKFYRNRQVMRALFKS